MRTIILSLLVLGCSHPAPPVTPNHAIEYVTILDHGARCEDWRDRAQLGATHSALCMSGDSLFWCVAPADSKPHCDLLFAPPKKTEATPPVSEQPKPKEP